MIKSVGLTSLSPSSRPSCNFNQNTFCTLGSGHHFIHVTCLVIIRRVDGSSSGFMSLMKIQMMIFSPLSSEIYIKKDSNLIMDVSKNWQNFIGEKCLAQ